jgi:hypothetical protein
MTIYATPAATPSEIRWPDTVPVTGDPLWQTPTQILLLILAIVSVIVVSIAACRSCMETMRANAGLTPPDDLPPVPREAPLAQE